MSSSNNFNQYICMIKEEEFKKIKKERSIRLIKLKEKLNERDQILLTLTDKPQPVIIAEYETISVDDEINGETIVRLEPIYEAPIHHGVKLNELVLMSLSTKLDFNKKITVLKTTDFEFLTRKLVA